jgi:hypothetical protein
MAWTETASLSFVARHESGDADSAARLLDDLEAFRAEQEPHFHRVPGEVAVVVHPRPLMLSLAAPWLPLARLASAPAGRRYFAGWFASGEIHVLSPAALERRASGVPGSREALLRSPRHEYAHLVLGASNPALPPPFSPATFRRYLRLAWLCEGAATYLAGQVSHMRAAMVRRLREGPRPDFPPPTRDAWVLGGTVFALLERERGRAAALELACDPQPGDAGRAAVESAFGLPTKTVGRLWADYLAEVTAA